MIVSVNDIHVERTILPLRKKPISWTGATRRVTVLASPDHDMVERCVRAYWKPERFERRDGGIASAITSCLDDIEATGHTLISRHESLTGQAEWLCTPAGLAYVVNLLTGSRELAVAYISRPQRTEQHEQAPRSGLRGRR